MGKSRLPRLPGLYLSIGLIVIFTLIAGGCKKPEIPPKDTIESRVREILSMPTFEHVYHDIVYLGEESKFMGIKTKDKQVLFSIDVTVQGGIDFTEGLEIDFKDGNSAVVSLPPAKILSVDADESTIKQYFVKELGGSISALQYYEEINRKKEFLQADAISRGILAKADANAVRLIGNLLELMGIENIEVQKLRPVNESAAGGDLKEPASPEDASEAADG